MEEQFYDTLNLLKYLNISLGGKVIDQEEFNEEERDIRTLVELKANIKNLIVILEDKKNLKNNKLMNQKLLELSLQYMTLIARADQMEELIVKIIKAYPD